MSSGDGAGQTAKKKEPPEKAENPNSQFNSTWVAIGVVLVSVLVGVGVYVISSRLQDAGDVFMVLGEKGKFLFDAVDLDGNGQLSVREFAPLVERLTGVLPPEARRSQGGGEQVKFETSFEPLILKTMKISKDVAAFLDAGPFFIGLKNWQTARQLKGELNSADFSVFLPSSSDAQVGSTWPMYTGLDDMLPNSRYYPPVTDGAERTFYRLLRLLHKNPFVQPRFGPKGAHAVLRAQNEDYYDIHFRFHAEFQLNEPPAPPFWFTPSQINGSLVISKTGLKIKHFHMEVPNSRLLNVDMEWMTSTSEEGMEVDIGHLPRMAVTSSLTSAADMQWQKAITEEEAQSELEKAFYPFKKVKYYPFEEAFARAAAEKKLVHSIAIWGALDDQSC